MYTQLTAVTSLTTCPYVRHAALSDVCVQQQQKQHMARAGVDFSAQTAQLCGSCTVLVCGCVCPSTTGILPGPCGTARKRAEESTNTNRIKMPPSRYVLMLLHIAAFPLLLLFLLQQHTHKQYDPFIIHGWHARATAIKHGAHKTGIKS